MADNQQDDILITPASSQSGQPAGQSSGSQQQGSAYSVASPAGQQPPQQTSAQPAATAPKKAKISLLEETDMIAEAAQTTVKKRSVPDNVTQKFPDLEKLIEETESMNKDERDYWFQILPIMTDDQIAKFRDILLNEKMQLDKLDKEYENKLEKLNEKHLNEWKEFESKERREAIAGAEKQAQEEERKKEEELLARLAEL